MHNFIEKMGPIKKPIKKVQVFLKQIYSTNIPDY
jgi:hypothetical protein